jgi:hypothetical protein
MLTEAIQNRDAQCNGVEAWDCVYKEHVLLIPWIYGLPGDNPMQSEMCSHIGMTGNLFCRVCKVSRATKAADGKTVRQDKDIISELLQVCAFQISSVCEQVNLELFVDRLASFVLKRTLSRSFARN